MDQVSTTGPQAANVGGFPYAHLPQGKIRLLTLSINLSGAIALSLAHYTYDTDLEYDALSYAWDRDGPRCTILCDGTPLDLGVDLLEALRNLAVMKTGRPLWVDYICINQPDEDEKSWQLKLMGQYYSRASHVWVWLGMPMPYDVLAMSTMSSLAATLPKLPLVQPTTDEWLDRNGLPRRNERLWDGLDSLFTRKWFDRIWTMQEFALATTSVFFCGTQTVPGSDFVSVADNLTRLGLTSLTRKLRIPRPGYKDGYHFATIAQRYWEEKRKQGSMSLELALQLGRFKESKGSNEHDRVYALLGLFDPKITARISARYTTPYCDMYVEVGKLSLRTSNHLEVLAQCPSRSRPTGLPSWCPNWNAENEAVPLYNDYYFAGFLRDIPSTPYIDFPVGSNRIFVKGICVTNVRTVATFSEKWDIEKGSNDVPNNKFAYTLRWLNECLELSRRTFGLSDQAVPEAFLRTLVTDVVSSQTGHSYETLHEMWISARHVIDKLQGHTDAVPLDSRQSTLGFNFLDSMYHVCRFRRFFVTQDSRLALGPDKTASGDKVVIFKNACTPFVLRGMEDNHSHELLGPAYVRELMRGQVLSPEYSDHWEMFDLA